MDGEPEHVIWLSPVEIWLGGLCRMLRTRVCMMIEWDSCFNRHQ